MKLQNDNAIIEKTVLKYFIRELKMLGLYHCFFEGVNYDKTMWKLVMQLANKRTKLERQSDNPFSRSESIDQIIKVLVNLNESIDRHHFDMRMMGGDETAGKVTMTINHLIHFFIERQVRSMEQINQIGQFVFDWTCNELYGKEYTDEMNRREAETIEKMGRDMAHKMPNMNGEDQAEIQMQWNEYLAAVANGYDGSFEKFMDEYDEDGEDDWYDDDDEFFEDDDDVF